MKRKKDSQNGPEDLRKRAEERLKSQAARIKELSLEEVQNLVHELQVHQLELEMQNEEIRRTQAELETALTKYTDLYDFAPVAYLTLDDRGWILEANLTAARLLGAERSRIVQQPLVAFLLPADRNRFRTYLVEVVKGQPVPSLELELIREGGAEVALQLDSLLVLDAADTSRVRTSLVDITERRRAQRVLAQYATDLNRSNAELEQFAYVASHDLQEPLRMVASFTHLLAKRYQGKLDQDADEFIGFIVDGVKRMQALINDLLAYSRVGTRGKPFAPTDCEAVWSHTLTNLTTALQETGAVVTHDPLPMVRADPVQLGQLLQNLLANALKFRGPDPPRVHLAAQRQGDAWIFSMQDNGIGIAPEHQERIFSIFQRLHRPEEFPGTGIGLAICKKIVERHKGRIWVESQPGKGSTFYFSIPKGELQ